MTTDDKTTARDPLTHPVKGDVWTTDEGIILPVVHSDAFGVCYIGPAGPVVFDRAGFIHTFGRGYCTITTRGDSSAALIAAAREAVEAAGRAVWAEVADLLPGYAPVNVMMTGAGMFRLHAFSAASITNVAVGRVIDGWHAIMDDESRDERATTGEAYSFSTPRAAVEALLAEVSRG